MFRIWKIKAESRLDALLARLKPSPLMARALPLSLLASLLIAEPAFAKANFEGLADNILGLLSNGLLRTLAIIAIIVVRSEEHTSELHSIMLIPYGVFYVKKKTHQVCTIDIE